MTSGLDHRRRPLPTEQRGQSRELRYLRYLRKRVYCKKYEGRLKSKFQRH